MCVISLNVILWYFLSTSYQQVKSEVKGPAIGERSSEWTTLKRRSVALPVLWINCAALSKAFWFIRAQCISMHHKPEGQ